MMANAQTPSKTLTGRAVLIAALAFFAVVFAVNGVFLFFALSTNTGVVANEPYRKGLKYNERIAADERQSALGWTSDISIDAAGTLAAILTDRDGKPVSGLAATAKVGRAATDREDIDATLSEQSPGRYETKLSKRQAGSYIANLEVSDPSASNVGVVYRARRRLWIRP
jgi:nitrogen fixation protein FixH